jgi:hypothetical protein
MRQIFQVVSALKQQEKRKMNICYERQVKDNEQKILQLNTDHKKKVLIIKILLHHFQDWGLDQVKENVISLA